MLKLALRIVGVVVLVAVLAIAGTVAYLILDAAKPEHPVGFEQVTVSDPEDKPLDVAIWYPTRSPSRTAIIGISAQSVAANGTVVGTDLPLIVISHGNEGLFSSHADTALALASAGFVVAAVTHTGDNARDQSYVGTPRWLPDRARHIHLLVDFMLNTWHAKRQIDPTRIGMFGFSAGGTTTLVAIGGVPDLARIGPQCAKQSELGCTLWTHLPLAPVPADAWIHDARIKAAVIAAPGYGFAFGPDGLSQVRAAVQLWNGAEDDHVPYATNEAVIRRLLPASPDYHAVSGGGHYIFVAPCPPWVIPMICSDAGNFDRRAFHRDFNRAVIAFFRKSLAIAGPRD